MGLENATNINSLNENNPLGTDPRSQGDDHIRMIKSVLKSDVFAASLANGSTDKATPVDADLLLIADSAASYGRKKLTWANLKEAIKSYYDSVTATLTNKTISGENNTLSNIGIGSITMNTGKLLGRTSSGTGEVEEIIIGSGLVLSGGALAINQSNWGTGVLASGADLNDAVNPGFYRLGTAHANAPAGVDYGQLIAAHGGGDTILQIVTGFSNDEIYWRQGNPPNIGGDGSWSPWHRFWHDGNIGTAFGSSLAANGWQRLPSGLIIQWGTAPQGYNSVVNLPIAFPNAAFQAVAVSSITASNSMAVVTNLTLTQITLANNNNGGTMRWLAWGI